MDAQMLTEVDPIDRLANRRLESREQPGFESGERDHDPVVVGIRVRVQDMRFARTRGDRVNDVPAPALRKIRDRLEEILAFHRGVG
jgi:hypothetical protein